MAKVIDVNPHVDTEAKRKAALMKFVIQSSAIESIHVTEEELSQNEAATIKNPPTETKT